MKVEDRRALLSGPRAEVRADEPLYFVPGNDQVTACRLMIAADYDWVSREGIEVVQGGFAVPDCVYQVYFELLDYPEPCCGCCDCEGVGMSFLMPSPVYEGNNEGTRIVGWGFGEHESWVRIDVAGFGSWEANDERLVLSDNVIEFWNQPYPPAGSGLTEMVFTITNARGEVSAPFSVPILQQPPMFTATSYAPTTITKGVPTDIIVQGTGFLDGDGLNIFGAPPFQFGYFQFDATEITPTSMTVPVTWRWDVSPTTHVIHAVRDNPRKAIRLTPDLTITP